MSNRWLGGFIQGGNFNPLGTQTSNTYYDVYTWGENNYGQLAQNLSTLISKSSPVQIGSNVQWSTMAEGANFLAYIKSDGTLWVCGRDTDGQLGQSTRFADVSSPIQVGALTNWAKVSVAGTTVAAIKTDGTLWTWGRNSEGQLGQNSVWNSYKSSPIQVGALTDWDSISVGARSYHFVARKTNGTLWSWGLNDAGQLGDNTRIYRSSPVQIGALTTWASATTSNYSTIALKTDGTLWSWGQNNTGQLGLGNTTYYSSPKQIGNLTNWTSKISGGTLSFYGIKSDGTLWSWGQGAQGCLGQNSTTSYSSPKQVGALTTWSKICAMQTSAAAIKTDGTLWTWGRNNVGQLGQNSITNLSSPVQVGAITTWANLPPTGDLFLMAWA